MSKMRNLIAIVAVLAVVTACAPARAPAPEVVEKEVMVERIAAEDEMAAARASGAHLADTDWALASVEERMIIWTGNISLIVKDAGKSLEEVEAIAKDLGGYVVSSNSWHQEEQLRANLTIRVPAEEFDTAMARLKDLAIKVENRNVSTQDVTEEYTDLDSQLRNLEATETELLELLTEVRERTGKAEDILAVHREVSNIRGQIEQVKGRMQYLEKMTAMATINIELIPDVLARPIVVAGWRPSGTVANALRTLVKTLQFIVDAAIWVIIYVLPTLVVIAIPFFILWMIWRRWRRRRKAA
jgi:chemotaxis protein histidine kinase CheA